MNVLSQILLTAFGAFIVFILGQITIRFLIDPIQQFKLMIGQIADTLIYYANVYGNPGINKEEHINEASDVMRRNATQLMAKYYAIPFKRCLSSLRIIHNEKDIIEVRKLMIFLSNSIYQGDPLRNHDARKKIEDILRIDLGD